MNNIFSVIVISILFLFIIYYLSNKKNENKYSTNVELMKKVILNSIYEDGPWIIDGNSFLSGKALVMLIKRIIENNINGDIIEAGCWRGVFRNNSNDKFKIFS